MSAGLSSDQIVKNEIIEELGFNKEDVELRIFPEGSNDDQKLFQNGKYLIVNFEIYDINYNAYNIARSITGPTYYPMVGYVFNLGKENYLKCEYDNFPDKSGKILNAYAYHGYIEDLEIISNYNNNTLIARHDNVVKLCKFKNNDFIFKKFPLEIKYDYYNIKKLKNNIFIIYSEHEMLLIKSY